MKNYINAKNNKSFFIDQVESVDTMFSNYFMPKNSFLNFDVSSDGEDLVLNPVFGVGGLLGSVLCNKIDDVRELKLGGHVFGSFSINSIFDELPIKERATVYIGECENLKIKFNGFYFFPSAKNEEVAISKVTKNLIFSDAQNTVEYPSETEIIDCTASEDITVSKSFLYDLKISDLINNETFDAIELISGFAKVNDSGNDTECTYTIESVSIWVD